MHTETTSLNKFKFTVDHFLSRSVLFTVHFVLSRALRRMSGPSLPHTGWRSPGLQPPYKMMAGGLLGDADCVGGPCEITAEEEGRVLTSWSPPSSNLTFCACVCAQFCCSCIFILHAVYYLYHISINVIFVQHSLNIYVKYSNLLTFLMY